MEIGQKVTLYPKRDDHQEHHRATVVALTPERVRVQIDGSDTKVFVRAGKDCHWSARNPNLARPS